MYECSPENFHRTRSLFKPLMNNHMFCAGVVEGLYSGRIFVDSLENPQTGFASKDGMWWFLAGNSYNEDFNKALNALLFGRHLNGEKGWGGMLTCHPDDWDAQIPAIFAPHIPIATQRLHYTCQHMNLDWRTHIPDDIAIRFIDQSLIEEGLIVEGTVAEVLNLRKSTPEPDHKAIGFVAIHNNKIVAHSVIDCIVGTDGDIGLFTVPEFRRRGLAYITSAAVTEYALLHGVEVVHWDCEAFNISSVRTAEKLGFELREVHLMYRLILNPILHEVNRAWSFIDAGNYPPAMEICQQQIESNQDVAHVHFYYMLARCYAELRAPQDTIKQLALAAKYGWDSVDETKADFSALVHDPAWNSILKQIEENHARS